MNVDTTVQEKAIAYPVDSRLIEIARHKVVSAAKRAGIQLKRTFATEGKELRRRAGGCAHAKQLRPYEFGVKSAVVVSHKHGLMLGARTCPGNPYDGHILNAALEQATNLT